MSTNQKQVRSFFPFLILQLVPVLVMILVGCNSTPAPVPPPTFALEVNPGAQVEVGKSVAIVAKVEPLEPLNLTWSVSGTAKGVLNTTTGEQVVYTPGNEGTDIVVAEGTTANGVRVKHTVTLTVIVEEISQAPTLGNNPITSTYTLTVTAPTQDTTSERFTSPTSTGTPTLPPTPTPLECRHPALTSYVFPQLNDVPGQRAFYGPVEESPDVFQCGGVRDIVRSTPVAVKIEYHIKPGTGKFGYFGIGTLGGYDVTQFKQICLWVYAEQPAQAFQLRLKDIPETERGVDVTVGVQNEWEEMCVDLDKFSEQGVNLGQLDNVNLGFLEANGSATVWIDDFMFTQ